MYVSLSLSVMSCCGFASRYYGEMPWASIPFSDAVRRRALAQRLGVRGIPALATVGLDGVLINQTAKAAAMQDPKVWNSFEILLTDYVIMY